MTIAASAIWRVRPGASFYATVSGTTLSVQTVSAGALYVGTAISGTSVPAGAYITGFITGTGGPGTYTLSASASIGTAESMTGVGGSNSYGGGFDPTIAPTASGSHGACANTTTFSDTTAAAFTSGMVGKGIAIYGTAAPPFYTTISGYTDASHVTVATSPGNLSGVLWYVYPGTDYSQQSQPEQSWTNLACTGSSSTTLSDASSGGHFTSAMVGNALQITGGTGFTAGVYFVESVTNSNSVVLDRTPASSSSAASAGSGSLGGSWADFWTNTATMIVAGNTIYMMGAGVPNPQGYAVDYSPPSYFTPVAGDAVNGAVTFAADPNMPSYGSGGMPAISVAAGLLFYNVSYTVLSNLWLFAGGANIYGGDSFIDVLSSVLCRSCVFDQNGYDAALVNGASCIGCEFFNSGASPATHANVGVVDRTYGMLITGCNFHNLAGPAITLSNAGQVVGCIIANNYGDGIQLTPGSTVDMSSVINNTIDGNGGNGITIGSQAALSQSTIFNNIISGNSSFGIAVSGGSQAANDRVKLAVDYNTFYSNASGDVSGLGYGPHDTWGLSQSPYVSGGTENYTLA